MLVRKDPILIQDSCAATAASDFTRKTNLENYGRKIRVKAIGVTNETTAAKAVNVGYMFGSVAYYFETLTLTTAGYFYISKPDILLPSNSQIILKFLSPAKGDKFKINIMCEEEVYSEVSNG